jgi:hypothetical protein
MRVSTMTNQPTYLPTYYSQPMSILLDTPDVSFHDSRLNLGHETKAKIPLIVTTIQMCVPACAMRFHPSPTQA